MISEVCCDCVRARREKDNADDDEGAMEGGTGWVGKGGCGDKRKKKKYACSNNLSMMPLITMQYEIQMRKGRKKVLRSDRVEQEVETR